MAFWGVLVFFLAVPNFVYIPIWIQTFFNSVAAVALGSLYSIVVEKCKKNADNISRSKSEEGSGDTMNMSDAIKFPFQASFALIALYVLFGSVDNTILLIIFKLNFSIMGVSCLQPFFHDRIHMILPRFEEAVYLDKTIRVWGEDLHLYLSKHNIVSYSLSIVINALYLLTDHWTLNNVLGLAFTMGGIIMLKVPNFKIIFVLLWCLFFYDIFWVFGSDVMVTVAMKFDVPIKLKFPNGQGKFSILGLGDMVIPGIILALSLKFDVDSFLEKTKENVAEVKQQLENLKTPIFNGALIGYAFGIAATLVSMFAMNHAQPALLFLVPGCTLGVFIPVIASKRFKQIWAYHSEGESKEEKKEK